MTLYVKAFVLAAALWLALAVGCFADVSGRQSSNPQSGVLPQAVQLGGEQNSSNSGNGASSGGKGTTIRINKPGSVASQPRSGASRNVAKPGKECTLKISAKGRQYTFNRVLSLGEGAYLVAVNDDVLDSFAKAYNTTISWDNRQVVAKRGGTRYTLGLGQSKMPADLGGRQLDAPCQMVGGTPYMPLVAAGDFCGVCISVNADGKSGVANSAITDVHLEADGEKQQLVVNAQHPINFKTFSLSKPERFVIDLNGGALNVKNTNIYHPSLGVIRLAQNSLNPAVTRIVIPLVAGSAIQEPSRKTGTKLVFGFDDSKSTYIEAPSAGLSEQRLTRCQVEDRGDKSLIHLSFSGPVQYQWVRLIAPDYRYFVDLPNVILSGNKKEMSVRNSSVRSVRISQHSHKPQPKTRVVLDMQKPLAVEIKEGGDTTSLDIIISSSTVPPNSSILTGTGRTSRTGVSSAVSSSTDPIVMYHPTSVNPSGQVRTICLDPGHGGADSGACNRVINLAEEDVTLDVSMRLTELLRRSGWKVVLTRETDRDVSYAGSSDSEELWARAKASNDCGADVFVSLHCNAAANTAAEGTSIHVYKQGDMVLGKTMIGPLISSTGRRNRGVQEDRFYVLAHTKMPAVLVEMAFITNREEGRLLADPTYRQRIAEGLAEGLNNYASLYLQGRQAAPTVAASASSKSGTGTSQRTTLGVPSRSTFSPPQTYQERLRKRDADAVLPQSVL